MAFTAWMSLSCTPRLRPPRIEGTAIFRRNESNGVELWTGHPSCQAAHDALVAALSRAGPFILPHVPLTKRIQGNLGEFIAMTVATQAPVQHTDIHALNAFQPLQDISHAGLDITYLYFELR